MEELSTGTKPRRKIDIIILHNHLKSGGNSSSAVTRQTTGSVE